MANGYKGEVKIKLDSEVFTLKFTWGARAVLRSLMGENYIERSINALIYRDPMDLALMLNAASDDAISVEAALASDWNLTEVAEKLKIAMKLSKHGFDEPDLDKVQKVFTKAQATQSGMSKIWHYLLGCQWLNFGKVRHMKPE